MSAKLTGKVWDADVKGNQQLTLLALADHGHHDGTGIYPSVAKIAWSTGLSKRTIQRILRNLVELGVLEVVIPPDNQNPTEYSMHLERLPQKEQWAEIRERNRLRKRADYDKRRGDRLTPRGDDKMSPQKSGVGVTNPDFGVTNRQLWGDTAVSPEPNDNLNNNQRAAREARSEKQLTIPHSALIQHLDNDAWSDWVSFRKQCNFKPYKTNHMARKLAELPASEQRKCVDYSIEKQYQGLFPEKFKQPGELNAGTRRESFESRTAQLRANAGLPPHGTSLAAND